MDTQSQQYHSTVLAAKRLYLRSLVGAKQTQDDVLLGIIAANRHSAFGKQHRFESIRSRRHFSELVPPRRYIELESWMTRAASGERSVLTVEPPIIFHRTSSTTGAPKFLPFTMRGALTRLSCASAHNASLVEYHPEVCAAPDSALVLTLSPHSTSVTSGGFPFCFFSETDWSQFGFRRHPGGPGVRAPWATIPRGVDDFTYYRVRLAVESSLTAILSWFPSSVVQLARVLRANSETIIREVHDGTLLGEATRTPNPTRATELEHILGRSVQWTLRDIWPKLSVVECWRTATSSIYLKQLESCIGEGVATFPAPYGSTESPIAMIVRPQGDAALLDVRCAFFEFLPVENEPNHELLLHDELEPGRDYVVVLTTPNGLYRYILEDVVRVHDYLDGVPLVEFRYRQGVTSSLTSEKLTEPQVMSAIVAVLADIGDATGEAVLCPVRSTHPHYLLALDIPVMLSHDRVERLATILESSLRTNANYAFSRSIGLFGSAAVELLTPGTFAAVREGRCRSGRNSLSQQKHSVIGDAADYEELKDVSQRLRRPSAVRP